MLCTHPETPPTLPSSSLYSPGYLLKRNTWSFCMPGLQRVCAARIHNWPPFIHLATSTSSSVSPLLSLPAHFSGKCPSKQIVVLWRHPGFETLHWFLYPSASPDSKHVHLRHTFESAYLSFSLLNTGQHTILYIILTRCRHHYPALSQSIVQGRVSLLGGFCSSSLPLPPLFNSFSCLFIYLPCIIYCIYHPSIAGQYILFLSPPQYPPCKY